MFRAPGVYPRAAVLRLETQAAHLNPLQSRQSVTSLGCSTGNDILAYNVANPGNEVSYTLLDSQQILPYSSLQVVLMAVPPARTPYLVPVVITAGMTVGAVATAIVTAIRAWVAAYRALNKDIYAMNARVVVDGFGTHAYVCMPWGMNGYTPGLSVGPSGTNLIEVSAGFDNPLIAGIVGPRRHIFPIRPRYDGGYYYGDVKIG